MGNHKDYFSADEKRIYYLNMRINKKSTQEQKDLAAKRLVALREAKPKVFVGNIRKKQNLEITVGDAIKELVSLKHLWDKFAKPNIVKEHHKVYDSEIQSLKKFRHANKLSLKDKIIF